jgi:hypothetical protein
MFEFSVNAGIVIPGQRIVIMYNSETRIFSNNVEENENENDRTSDL